MIVVDYCRPNHNKHTRGAHKRHKVLCASLCSYTPLYMYLLCIYWLVRSLSCSNCSTECKNINESQPFLAFILVIHVHTSIRLQQSNVIYCGKNPTVAIATPASQVLNERASSLHFTSSFPVFKSNGNSLSSLRRRLHAIFYLVPPESNNCKLASCTSCGFAELLLVSISANFCSMYPLFHENKFLCIQ